MASSHGNLCATVLIFDLQFGRRGEVSVDALREQGSFGEAVTAFCDEQLTFITKCWRSGMTVLDWTCKGCKGTSAAEEIP